jgi:beta-glucanase (GH16 family)
MIKRETSSYFHSPTKAVIQGFPMKSHLILPIALPVCCLWATTALGAPELNSKIVPPPGMKLVWNDEFDRDGAPDPTKWGFETGFARNHEDQWYQADNATVKDGLLTIEARRERKANPNYEAGSGDWKKNREFAEYTSSSMSTNNKGSWTYGHFEMRAKIDTRLGLWPAFWTVGQTGEWPAGGEIDIMEFYRGGLLANFVWGTNQRWNGKWNAVSKPITEFGDPDWANKFHIWTMDWDEKKIVLSVDGQVMNSQDLDKTINGDVEAKNPFHAPQFIILNVAVGGDNGGDPSKTDFPARMEVDYVRVFQKL